MINNMRARVNRTRAAAITSTLNGEQLPDIIVLVCCFGLLAGAVVLTPPLSDAPDVRLGEFYLPSLCTFYNLTGHPCPGCGLVRSVTAAAHGDLATSLVFHRLGWLVLAYILAQTLYRGILVFVPPWRARVSFLGGYLLRGLIVVVSLLTVNWLSILF